MSTHRSRSNVALWIIQGLLAALFLFAGGMKLAIPSAQLAAVAHMPAPFLKFIGACEVLGALGLVLPGLFRIRPWLTPLAAIGLLVIMAGAVTVTVATQGASAAMFPLATGMLTGLVAVGRRPRGTHQARFTTAPEPFAR
jgi:hypothetical protein